MDNTITVNMENLTQEERNQLFSLVEKSNKQNSKKRWRAERDETYYLINQYLDAVLDVDKYFAINNQHYKIGNYFKTKEEAEFEREKFLVYQELKDYALEHNKSKINWNDTYQLKYYIYYDYYHNTLEISSTKGLCNMFLIYFTSIDIAQNAIDTIGEDRIKKYLFGVK